MNELRLFTIELIQEIAYRARRATWHGVWAWFTYAGGARLFVAVASAAYLLWAWL